MTRTIRGIFKDGVVRPVEPVEVPEGAEVTVTFNDTAAGAPLSAAERLRRALDSVTAIAIAENPEAARDDWGRRHDEVLYCLEAHITPRSKRE